MEMSRILAIWGARAAKSSAVPLGAAALWGAIALAEPSPQPTSAPDRDSAHARIRNLGLSLDGEGFVAAVTARNRSLSGAFLQSGISLESEDAEGRTPLFAAVVTGQWDLAEDLLKGGANPGHADAQGRTPLMAAVLQQEAPMVQKLLDRGADLSQADRTGLAALHYAATTNDPTLTSLLLRHGADPNLVDHRGHTPLHLAAAAGREAVLGALLDGGADPAATDNAGHRALHLAVIAGSASIVTRLLPLDPDALGPCCKVSGLAAHAFASGQWPVIELVLGASEPLPRWSPEALAWMEKAFEQRSCDHARLVLSKHSRTPQHPGSEHPLAAHLIAEGKRDYLRFLIEQGMDPNIDVQTPAQKDLLQKVAPSNFRDYLRIEPGMTLLMLAAALGSPDDVRFLIEKGAQRNARTSRYKMTALHFAAAANNAPTLQAVIGGAPPPEELRVEISLRAQQASVLRNGTVVLQTAISTGRPGYSTPTGDFVVTDRHLEHSSTIYKVPMPFFLRLNCRDFGMHAGNTSSPFASHGCIRVPPRAAEQLFREVPQGTLVQIRP